MESNNSNLESVSFSDYVRALQSSVPADEQVVASHLENPGDVERFLEDQVEDDDLERRMAMRGDSRGYSTKIGTTDDPALVQEPGRREGETRAGREKREGREQEQGRHAELAYAAELAGEERAKASRHVVGEMDWHQTNIGTTEVSPMPVEWAAENDLTETLDEEVASQVREQAARIQERVDGSPSAGLVRRWISERVRRGQDIVAAVDAVHREAQRWDGAVQTISTIRWGDSEATVEGDIETLWDPKGSGQQQVGILQDDEGQTVKLTIWQNSMKTVRLREGDRVKVEGAKVNVHNERVTLAATSETTIRVLERGEGEAPWNPKGTPNRPDDPTPPETGDEIQLVCPVDECDYEGSTRRMELHVEGMAKDGCEAHADIDGDVASLLEDGQYVLTRTREETPPKKFPEEREDEEWTPTGHEETGEACPRCESRDTSRFQRQMGSADEGATGFHRCNECDKKWRSGYGA